MGKANLAHVLIWENVMSFSDLAWRRTDGRHIAVQIFGTLSFEAGAYGVRDFPCRLTGKHYAGQ